MSAAGDVNGDGYSDVLVGAPGYSHPESSEGRAVVYLGSDSGPVLSSWAFEADKANALLGASVASAGDVNGDGIDDVIVGASNYNSTQPGEGRVWVFHGSLSGLGASPAWNKVGGGYNDQFGTSVAAAGDVNGDGFGDVIIGAPAQKAGKCRATATR